MLRKKDVCLFALLATLMAHPASAQSLDLPQEYKTFEGKSGGARDDAIESEFEISGNIEIDKSDLVICSEGAAFGENLDQALAACDRAVEKAPEDGNAYYFRGFTLYHLERFAEAETNFTRAIENKTSRLAESYYQRGVCKERQRRLREASSDFMAAYDIKPEWSAAGRKVEEYQWAYDSE